VYKHGLHLFLAALCFIVCCQPVAAAHVPSSLEEHASEKADLILKNRVWDFCGYPAECAEQKALQVPQSQWVAKAGRSRIVLGQALQLNGDGSVGGFLFDTSYEPGDFYLTTKDGHVYHYNTSGGLVDEHDRNGVSLTFTHTGIFSSTGASIAYTRDPVTDRISAITDPNGNQITYGYDNNGNLISETDQAGRTCHYSYLTTPAHYLNQLLDANGNPIATTAYTGDGRLSTYTDALGNITTFIYDTVNNIQTKIEPLDPTTNTNPTTVTFYDARGNVIQVTNEIGSVSTTTFDSNNNPLVVVPPCGCKTVYTYDSNGNQLTKTDPLGNVITTAYDSLNNPISVTDARGNTTYYQYDGSGNLTTTIDPLGNITAMTNDSLGRLIASTDPLGHTTQFTYIDDPNTGIASTKPSVVTNVDGSTHQFTYNSFGSVISETDENGNTTQLVTDSGGILQQRIEADGSTTSYAYNGNGSLVSVTDALGKITSMKYDLAFNLIERDGPNGDVTTFTYDQLNRLSSKIDPLGRTTTRSYRADGVVQSITQPDNTIIAFDNDTNGRRTGVTDPDGNHTTVTYNANSQVLTQTDPLGKTTQYSYDPNGNVSSTIDRLNRVRAFTYDANNRPTQEQWYASPTTNIPLKTITTGYDVAGNLTGTSDDTGTFAMQYDGRNRMQTLTTTYTGQASFVLQYSYDPGSRLTSVSDGDGVSVGTAYDQRNNVSQLIWQGTGIAARANFTHDPLGGLSNIKRYSDIGTTLIGQSTFQYARNLPNIGYQAVAYNAEGDEALIDTFKQTEAFGPLQDADAAGLLYLGTQPLERLGQINNQDGSGNILSTESYSNDLSGQLSTKTVAPDTISYSYDKTGQLLTANHSATTSVNETYSYDPAGNRTSTNTEMTKNTIGTGNRITSDALNTYRYDNEGNLISRTAIASGDVWIYTYDLRNRMTNAAQLSTTGTVLSQASYSYDLFDRRITKNVNGQITNFFYHGNNLWKQMNSSGTSHYLTDGSIDGWIARSNSAGINWYLTDRLGSITGLTDDNGKLINSTTYDSYGHIASQSNPTAADQFAFTGREFDQETGLYYFRARYYNPDLGTFLSDDPIGFESGTFNITSYCQNSPVNSFDNTGYLQQFPKSPKKVGTNSEYLTIIAIILATDIALDLPNLGKVTYTCKCDILRIGGGNDVLRQVKQDFEVDENADIGELTKRFQKQVNDSLPRGERAKHCFCNRRK
jgi:RHS repeat-associated protein